SHDKPVVIPDAIKNKKFFTLILFRYPKEFDAAIIPQIKNNIITVLMPIAIFESMFLTPNLHNIAVNAAKNADNIA
ncbi:MAG: hypothetical protein ACI37T_03940, partial [Candidatus Gastranaerophilaceae bacterium]